MEPTRRSSRLRAASTREQGSTLSLFDLPLEAIELIYGLTAPADRTALRLLCQRSRQMVNRGVVLVKIVKGHGLSTHRPPLPSLALVPLRLRYMELQCLAVGAEGAALLAAADWPTLHTLRLRNVDLGDAGVAALAAGRWPALRALALDGNKIRNAGAVALAAMQLPAIDDLSLSYNSIGRRGAAFLAAGAWPALEWLDLSRNATLGDAGASALAAGAWPALYVLRLNNCGVGTAALAALASADWPALWQVELTDIPMTFAAELRLIGTFHGANIQFTRSGRGDGEDSWWCHQHLLPQP